MLANQAKQPVKQLIIQNNLKRVHSKYPTEEWVEEYDLKTDLLLTRRIKKKTTLGREVWIYEVGEPPAETGALQPVSTAPFIVRKDTKSQFVWRIRNLPYPFETYQLSLDGDNIIVRTSNKKYFKLIRYFTKIQIPDMMRLGLKLSNDYSYEWGSNTLVVKYKKPALILKKEADEKAERDKLVAQQNQHNDAEPQCNQQ